MDSVKMSYRILFNLQFSMKDYNDDIVHYIKLLPDEETGEFFSAYRMLSRSQKNSSVALIEVEPEGTDLGKPRTLPAEGDIFRFQIKISDQSFFSRTHLASYDFSSEVLMLSNEVNHVEGTEILLSRTVAAYNSAGEYQPGYIVKSGSKYYKAIQASDASDPHAVNDSDYWEKIDDGSFVSQADLQTRPTDVDLDTIMVIDIRYSSSLPSAYQLLDGSMKCKEISYTIKLLTT